MNKVKGLLGQNSNYTDTYWSDGSNTVTISDIQNKLEKNSIPIIEEPSEKYTSIHDKKIDKETLDRAMASNLYYPIIVITKNSTGEQTVIDGHHRLKKAKLNNLPIKVRKIDISVLPKEWDSLFF